MTKLDHGKLAYVWLIMMIWQEPPVKPVKCVRLPDAQTYQCQICCTSCIAMILLLLSNKCSNGSERSTWLDQEHHSTIVHCMLMSNGKPHSQIYNRFMHDLVTIMMHTAVLV